MHEVDILTIGLQVLKDATKPRTLGLLGHSGTSVKSVSGT